jgi:hypothetical protein
MVTVTGKMIFTGGEGGQTYDQNKQLDTQESGWPWVVLQPNFQ